MAVLAARLYQPFNEGAAGASDVKGSSRKQSFPIRIDPSDKRSTPQRRAESPAVLERSYYLHFWFFVYCFEPNYVDPVLRGNANIIGIVIFYPILVFMIAIRFYTRLRISRSLGPDDYLICAAFIPATGFTIVGFLAEFVAKWNRHVWDVPIPDIVLGLKLFLVTQIIFSITQMLTKLSMLALVYRIMKTAGGLPKLLTQALFLVVLVQDMIFVVTVIFQCRPPQDYWTLTLEPQPQCINQTAHVLAAGIINTCTNFLVVILPLPTVLQLNLPRRQQVIISLLFAAGGVVCIAGAARVYYTYLATSTVDPTWEGYGVWLSGSIELYVGMIGASVPATKPFFQRFLPWLLDSALSTGGRPPLSSPRQETFRTPRCVLADLRRCSDVEMGNVGSSKWTVVVDAPKRSSSSMSSFHVVPLEDTVTLPPTTHSPGRSRSKEDRDSREKLFSKG